MSMNSLGHIGYDHKGGALYAKICISHYVDGKDKKTYENLGRVIDKEKGIYHSRKRGLFSYDPNTGVYTPLDVEPQPAAPLMERPLIRSFGDVWFLDHFIRQEGIYDSIHAMHLKHEDAFLCMVYFYVINSFSLSRSEDWLESSYASLLYPDACLSSQRCSEILKEASPEPVWRDFFKAHFLYLDKQPGANEFKKILVDSTGLPNDIHFHLTAVNTHNGITSNEVRLIYVTEKDSGLPMYMRVVAGNITDKKTLPVTVARLQSEGMKIDMALMDAGYYDTENILNLYSAGIDFVCRMDRNLRLYKDLIKAHRDELICEENIQMFNDRILYIRKVKLENLVNGYTGYAFICLDLVQRDIEELQAISDIDRKHYDLETMHEKETTLGTFILVSSKDLLEGEVLPVYYTRQMAEKTFHISKGEAHLEPLRVQSEETLRGHLLISFLATLILRRMDLVIRKKRPKKSKHISSEEIIQNLGYHRCNVYPDHLITEEANAKANVGYKLFDICAPIELPLESR